MKKYYRLKLSTNFLTSEIVDYLVSQDTGNGFKYVVLYQCLLLKTLNTNGKLETIINEIIIPYDLPKLQRELKRFSDKELLRGLQLFQELGLVYVSSNGSLVMSEHENAIGIASNGVYCGKLEKDNQHLLENGGYENIENKDTLNESKEINKSKEKKESDIKKNKETKTNKETKVNSRKREIEDKGKIKNFQKENTKEKVDQTKNKSTLWEILVENSFVSPNEPDKEKYMGLFENLLETYDMLTIHIKVLYFAKHIAFKKQSSCWSKRGDYQKQIHLF